MRLFFRNLSVVNIFNIFKYIGYDEGHNLIKVSNNFRSLVSQFKWNDLVTLIEYDIKTWNEYFPNAIGVSISRKVNIKNTDFVYLQKIKYLNISGSNSFTDFAFEYLSNVETLDISHCYNISNNAFKYLKKIKTLNMSYCRQKSITEEAFKYIYKTLKILYINDCYELNDTAIKYLGNLEILNIACIENLTNKVIDYIKNIPKVYIGLCQEEEFAKNKLFKNLIFKSIFYSEDCDY